MSLRKALAYVWDLRSRKEKALEDEARHPYAKIQDKVERDRVVRKRRVVPFRKVHKDVV